MLTRNKISLQFLTIGAFVATTLASSCAQESKTADVKTSDVRYNNVDKSFTLELDFAPADQSMLVSSISVKGAEKGYEALIGKVLFVEANPALPDPTKENPAAPDPTKDRVTPCTTPDCDDSLSIAKGSTVASVRIPEERLPPEIAQKLRDRAAGKDNLALSDCTDKGVNCDTIELEIVGRPALQPTLAGRKVSLEGDTVLALSGNSGAVQPAKSVVSEIRMQSKGSLKPTK